MTLNASYAPKAPALTGVFYCFNGLTNRINQPSIPGTIAHIERAFLLDTDNAADRCYDQAVDLHAPSCQKSNSKPSWKK